MAKRQSLRMITGSDIRAGHPTNNSHQTDYYYTRLANRLADCFRKLDVDFGDNTASVIQYSSVILTNYMEDIVADCGLWRTFSSLCQQHLGIPVPLYHDDEEYYPDEPSLAAIRFLVWHAANEMTDNVYHADTPRIWKMAQAAYDLLDEEFEQAPINEQLVSETHARLGLASMNFDSLRTTLKWLYRSYLIRCSKTEELIQMRIEEAERTGFMPDKGMHMYYAQTHCIFAYKIGPLALYTKDWLAALMRTKDMQQEAQDVDAIEVTTFGTWKYDFKDNETLHLVKTDGMEIDILADELNMPRTMLQQHDGCGASFVRYQGEWHLNGIMYPIKGLHEKWQKFCEDDPMYQRPGTKPLTAEHALKLTKGKRIEYFSDCNALKKYLHENLNFPFEYLHFVDEKLDGQPVLFVDETSKTHVLQFFYGYAPCIADPDNPFYDPEYAKEEVNEMLHDTSVSTALIQYLLRNNFLPDLNGSTLFCHTATASEKNSDTQFYLRYLRQEKY